jgi:hypothetical protein
VTNSAKADTSKQPVEDLEGESEQQGKRVEEAEEPSFTTRRKNMREGEDPENERKGKKTSKDYA